MEKRVIATDIAAEDIELEHNLRPQGFDSYTGQEKVKETMKVYIEASKLRKEALDHVLLYGPPGLGKTTLSNIIASEMGSNIKTTSGSAIERAGDMAVILNDLGEGDIVFIDEIHRLSRVIEEVLYPAMEDFMLDILEVDKMGLDMIDRKMLLSLIEKFGDGPVGLDTLAVSINEEAETIEDVYEPYLIQLGYIQRTPRGRVATELCYRHFGLGGSE